MLIGKNNHTVIVISQGFIGFSSLVPSLPSTNVCDCLISYISQLVREMGKLANVQSPSRSCCHAGHAGCYGNPEEEHAQPGKFGIKFVRGCAPGAGSWGLYNERLERQGTPDGGNLVKGTTMTEIGQNEHGPIEVERGSIMKYLMTIFRGLNFTLKATKSH